mgnify:CR=1 FL=1
MGVFYFAKPTLILPGCQINEVRKTPVSLELAKFVASDQVHRNNPPFVWVYVGSQLVYSSLGDINYYIIVFRKNEFTTFTTLEQLGQNAKLYSDSTQEGSENKYQFNDIATVMTGTMKEDKLIIRHFKGIPESIGKRLEIKEFVESKYAGKTIGDLVSDSPMSVGYYKIIDKNSGKPSDNVISVLDFSIVSLSSLVQNQEDIQNRKEQTYSTYEKDECESYKNALEEAKQAHILEWNSFD